jgi:hypothetical protein
VTSIPPSVLSTQDSNQDINQLTLELQETRGKLEELKKENERLEQLSAAKTASLGQGIPEDFEIHVVDNPKGEPVAGARIVIVRRNEVVYSGITHSDGAVILPAISAGPLRLFVAHMKHLGFFGRRIPTGLSCTVGLSFREGIGSLVFFLGQEKFLASPRRSRWECAKAELYM